MSDFSRRTIVRGTAWSVPVVAIAASVPAFAASAPPIIITGYTEAGKCPGKSAGGNDNEFTYIFTFTTTTSGVTPSMFTIAGAVVTINGTVFTVKEIKTEPIAGGGTRIYVITVPSTNSADGTGDLYFTYSSGQPPQSKTAGPFPYDGTHPNQNLCRNI